MKLDKSEVQIFFSLTDPSCDFCPVIKKINKTERLSVCQIHSIIVPLSSSWMDQYAIGIIDTSNYSDFCSVLFEKDKSEPWNIFVQYTLHYFHLVQGTSLLFES